MRAADALARRALADARTRTLSFAVLFALVGLVNVVGYRSAYPTRQSRLILTRTLGANGALRLFYGRPYDLLSAGGYAAWRVGGVLAIFAAVFGVLAAVRALRAEEEAGRAELALSGAVGRRGAYLAALAAIAASALTLWLAATFGLIVAGLPAGGSAYLGLAMLAPLAVFAGVGAVASQLAPTRRSAIELSAAVLVAAFLLRVVADSSAQLDWLRWLTPLGWAEELRPFAAARPAALVPLAAVTAAALVLAGWIAARRDVGSGLLGAHDRADADLRLLGSPDAQALRAELGSLSAWLVGCAFFAFIIGMVSTSVASAGLSNSIAQQLQKLGGVSILTAPGYIGLTFLFFVAVLSVFACAQIAAARAAEADQQLETLLALPVGRRRWLLGRLALAAAALAVIGLLTGAAAWAGAATQHAGVGLGQMLEAGANCLPASLLFLGLAALAFALAPRAAVALAYAGVAVAFLWQLFGGLLSAPQWLLELTPFAHIGLIPAQSFRAGPAVAMVAIGAVASLAALWQFGRRDLIEV